MNATYTVEECYRQVGGGIRYAVSGPKGVAITVDEDAEGTLSGFVRGPAASNEATLLRGAFDAVRRSNDDN